MKFRHRNSSLISQSNLLILKFQSLLLTNDYLGVTRIDLGLSESWWPQFSGEHEELSLMPEVAIARIGFGIRSPRILSIIQNHPRSDRTSLAKSNPPLS